jgi:PEP-CTERM motif-containing protein
MVENKRVSLIVFLECELLVTSFEGPEYSSITIEGIMSKRSLWLVALAGLVLSFAFSGTAKADTVYVDGSYAFANGGNGIPPYGGTLNGQSQQFYCVDFSTPIWAGESWQVTVTSLTGSNFSLTKLKNQTSYLEMAWLITQMMSATTPMQKAMDQYAIWSFTGGPNPYGSNNSLVAAALAAVQGGFTGAGWEILTPTGSAGQEFLIFVGVPEPGQLLLLLVGLGFVAVAARKKGANARATA